MRTVLTRTLAAAVAVAAVISAPTAAEAAKKTVRVSGQTDLYAQFHDVTVGEKVKVHGYTTQRNRKLLVQRKVGGRWATQKTIRSRRGSFATQVKPVEGTNRYRVVAQRRVINGPKVRWVLPRAVSGVVVVKATAPEPPVTVIDTTPAEASLVGWHLRRNLNVHRATLDLPQVEYNACLTQFAMAHSTSMAVNEKFAHSRDPFFTTHGAGSYTDACYGEASPWRGEALALVYAESAEEAASAALNGWLNSPNHKSIIESTLAEDGVGLDEIGVGVARTSDGFWWITFVIASE